MSRPETENWSAVETTDDFAGGGRKLTVRGRVYVGNLGDEPSLNERELAGTEVLGLDLTITSGIGGTVMNWKPVEHVRPISDGEGFSKVEIYSDGELIQSIDVEVIHS